jgi:hypothetical protein
VIKLTDAPAIKILSDIMSDEIDIYDIMYSPANQYEHLVSREIHSRYQKICSNNPHLHPDDDFDVIVNRIRADLLLLVKNNS